MKIIKRGHHEYDLSNMEYANWATSLEAEDEIRFIMRFRKGELRSSEHRFQCENSQKGHRLILRLAQNFRHFKSFKDNAKKKYIYDLDEAFEKEMTIENSKKVS